MSPRDPSSPTKEVSSWHPWTHLGGCYTGLTSLPWDKLYGFMAISSSTANLIQKCLSQWLDYLTVYSDFEEVVKQPQNKSVKFSDGSSHDVRTTTLPPLKTPPMAPSEPFLKEAPQGQTDDQRPSSKEKMTAGDRSSQMVSNIRKGTPELPSITKPGSGKPGSGRSRPSSTSSRHADPSIVLTYLRKNTYDNLGKSTDFLLSGENKILNNIR